MPCPAPAVCSPPGRSHLSGRSAASSPKRTMWRRVVRQQLTSTASRAYRKHIISADPRPYYPTIGQLRLGVPTVRLPQFVADFHKTDFSQCPDRRSPAQFQLEGRVLAVRKSGKGLHFLDLVQDNHKVQIVTSNKLLKVSADDFAKTLGFVRKGDHVTCVGHAYRTNSGELSLQASEYVRVASPCLDSTAVPDKLRTRRSINHNRVMNFLVDPALRQRIAIRSRIILSIRAFLVDREFLEVQTPIISGRGTGANAEPFHTSLRFLPRLHTEADAAAEGVVNDINGDVDISDTANANDTANTNEPSDVTANSYETSHTNGSVNDNNREASSTTKRSPSSGTASSAQQAGKYEPLQLRVAPELWLKKLVIAGFDKVFEIGPNFRNEGIDATHNPEFLTCEFYRSFTSLEELMNLTEAMFARIYHDLAAVQRLYLLLEHELPKLCNLGAMQFPRYEFIPTIEAATGVELPRVLDEASLLKYYSTINLPVPAQKTPASLLDNLSSTFLETLSVSQPNTPVIIFNQPSIMSPLAKSAIKEYGSGSQRQYDISLRFELFINGKEYVNSYEEENSPFDQKAKFLLQQQNKREYGDVESVVPDWHYVQAMQYGLPPTGGWGCGIDRLAMLFTGASRIEDVLTFGTLKDVIRQ